MENESIMGQKLVEMLEEGNRIREKAVHDNLNRILMCVDFMVNALVSGHKILLFGNGGSAADAQHIAAEFVNRFKMDRTPLPAIALTTDTSVITSIGNDYDFSEIFSRQVAAVGKKHDIAVGISTSGSSPNVIKGIETAGEIGMQTIGLTGQGGDLAEMADISITVDSRNTPRVQEVHITIAHFICELVESILFPGKSFLEDR